MPATGPYYNRYDRTKQYVQLLAIPGRVAQASEWNDQGSMFLDFIQRLGDATFVNGNVIDGCDIILSGTSVRILEGRIYLEGLIRDVTEQELTITGTGEENICAYVEESIVTEAQDPSLNDPATGAENYGQPGCHALKQEVKFGINIESAPVIYKIINGAVSVDSTGTNEYSVLTDILARRTFDESGNYRVSGMTMSAKGSESDSTIDVTLKAGKAYIKGYEVAKPSDTTFQINKALSVREVQGETHNMDSGNMEAKRFVLSNFPCAEIHQLSVVLKITENITRGSRKDGIDYLPHTPVYAIDEVKSTDDATTYVAGTDWQRSGDTIDWSLLGDEPEIGTTYKVTYRYTYTLGPEEFDLVNDFVNKTSTVTIIGEGISPVQDSGVIFNYSFSLARKDLISITKDGDILVTEGYPDVERLTKIPVVTDDNVLNIGSITVPAQASNITISNLSIDNSTMEDIQKTVRRVNDLEYNQAISDLDNEAISGEPPTELKGVFTDGFIGFSKADFAHELYDCLIDLDSQELQLPFNDNIVDLTVNEGNYSTIKGEMGVVMTTPYSEETILSQPLATRPLLVNPYSVFDPVVPITLEPAVDNWIDYEHITYTENQNVYVNADLHGDIGPGNAKDWWRKAGSKYFDDLSTVEVVYGSEYKGIYGSSATASQTVTDAVVTQEKESLILYMRPREVILESSGFAPYADSIHATFDDREISLTPMEDTTAGTKDGSVRANALGKIKCRFNVPEKVPCGTKAVKLFFDGDDDNPAKSGETVYKAEGRLHTTTTTIFTTTTIVHAVDPLAQTFQFDEEKYLTSVDLFFQAKDEQIPVVVQCRNTVNGYPGTTCYGEVVLTPDMISVSDDASAMTTAKFNNAIKLSADTQYCIVVMTDSPIPALWVAKLGEPDIKTKEIVTSNPYTAGVLFASSNNLAWTAYQDQDMKINIKAAVFTENGSVIFNEVALGTASSLVLACDSVIPSNTELQWYYQVPGGAWTPFESFNEEKLASVITSVGIKCEFKGIPSRAPMVSKMCMSLATFMTRSTGCYISRNVTLEDGYTDLKLYLDVAKPTGSEVKVYWSKDDGGSWTELKNESATTETVDAEFIRYYWNSTELGDAQDFTQFRVRIDLSASNVIAAPRCKRLMCILKDI